MTALERAHLARTLPGPKRSATARRNAGTRAVPPVQYTRSTSDAETPAATSEFVVPKPMA